MAESTGTLSTATKEAIASYAQLIPVLEAYDLIYKLIVSRNKDNKLISIHDHVTTLPDNTKLGKLYGLAEIVHKDTNGDGCLIGGDTLKIANIVLTHIFHEINANPTSPLQFLCNLVIQAETPPFQPDVSNEHVEILQDAVAIRTALAHVDNKRVSVHFMLQCCLSTDSVTDCNIDTIEEKKET